MNGFMCEMIGMILEMGANVDAPAPCTALDFERSTPFSNPDSSRPAALHTSLVEIAFYKNLPSFDQVLQYSEIPHGRMSQARLLRAAVEGCEALKAYLCTTSADTSDVKGHLESYFAKIFSYTAESNPKSLYKRIQVIHNLLLYGVDPTLSSMGGSSEYPMHVQHPTCMESKGD